MVPSNTQLMDGLDISNWCQLPGTGPVFSCPAQIPFRLDLLPIGQATHQLSSAGPWVLPLVGNCHGFFGRRKGSLLLLFDDAAVYPIGGLLREDKPTVDGPLQQWKLAEEPQEPARPLKATL